MKMSQVKHPKCLFTYVRCLFVCVCVCVCACVYIYIYIYIKNTTLFQGCMNNVTFGDESSGYYETVAGGAGAVRIIIK